jgi:hypothetical protein
LTTRYGFLSTYPPTLCGLATFTSALRAELVPGGESGPVVRAVEGVEQSGSQEIAANLVAGDPLSVYRAASVLNDCDVAIVQHEYGVYGGPDGDELLTLFDALTVPIVVVLHTVLSRPTAHQRTVLERVAGFATVVTMTSTARQPGDRHTVDMSKVSVIPRYPVRHVSHVPTFRGRPYPQLGARTRQEPRGASRRCPSRRSVRRRASWSLAKRTRKCCAARERPIGADCKSG